MIKRALLDDHSTTSSTGPLFSDRDTISVLVHDKVPVALNNELKH